MRNIFASSVVISLTLATLCSATLAATKNQDKQQPRKRDGSCQTATAPASEQSSLTGTPSFCSNSRLDGNCGGRQHRQLAARKGHRTGPQDGSGPRRDGSCQ